MRTRLVLGILVGLLGVVAWRGCATGRGVRVTVTRETPIWPTNECGDSRDVSARWASFYIPAESTGTIQSYRYGKDYECLNVELDVGRRGYVMFDGSQLFDRAALSPLDEERLSVF